MNWIEKKLNKEKKKRIEQKVNMNGKKGDEHVFSYFKVDITSIKIHAQWNQVLNF